MKLLFKKNNSGLTGDIVGHYDFRQHYSGVNFNMRWDTLSPFIRQATTKYVIPFLTADLYGALADLHEAGTGTDEQKDLINHLQDSIAYYAIFDGFPHLNLSVADMGIQQLNATEGTAAPANQWSFKNARWDALRSADTFLDLALAHMEAQIKAGNTFYNAWKASKAYKAKGSTFFEGTEDLDNYINIQSSRRAYMALGKYLLKSEEKYLCPVLGTDLYNEIKTQLAENTLSATNLKLIALIKRLVSEWGLFEAIPHISILVEGDGIRVLSSNDGMDDRKSITNPFQLQAIAGLRASCEENARTARADLLSFLQKNHSDYPLFVESGAYVKDNDLTTIYESEDHIGGIFI